jgi:hypothetical protein
MNKNNTKGLKPRNLEQNRNKIDSNSFYGDTRTILLQNFNFMHGTLTLILQKHTLKVFGTLSGALWTKLGSP